MGNKHSVTTHGVSENHIFDEIKSCKHNEKTSVPSGSNSLITVGFLWAT